MNLSDKTKIIEDYKTGQFSKPLLAERLGLREQDVVAVLKEAGISNPRIKSERNQQIISDYKSKMTLKEIALKHGISVSRVTYLLRRSNIPSDRLGSIQHKNVSQIESLIYKGYKVSQIANELGCSVSSVHKKLRESKSPVSFKDARWFKKFGLSRKDFAYRMYDLYINENKSIYRLGKDHNVDPSNIRHLFKVFNLKLRTSEK